MSDVRPRITDITVHLPHDTNMLITVQQRILVVFYATAAAMRGFVRLKAGVGQHDNQTLGILIGGGDGHVLLGDELG